MAETLFAEPAESVQATRIDSMITYPVSKTQIAELKTKFSGMTCADTKGYEATRKAIAECRTLRTAVEKRRKELKADSIEFGRKVDTVAKFLTAEIESVEIPLIDMKQEVDDAKERERLRKEEEKAEELRKLYLAEKKAEEERLAAIAEANRIERERLEAEAKRLAEENRILREKAEAEARRVAEEAAAKQRVIDEANRIEREKIEAEKRRVEAARQKAEREEFERQAKIKAEEAAKAKLEAEERAKAQAKAAAEAEAKRVEAMRPDVEKVHLFANEILSMTPPSVKSSQANKAMDWALAGLDNIASTLKKFKA